MEPANTIQEEKLQNILMPQRGNSEFKITLRFQKFLSKSYEQALELARQTQHFFEEGDGDSKRIYVSFGPNQIDDLHRIFELIKNREETRIYINNKVIPYGQDLWLFLAWFYRIK